MPSRHSDRPAPTRFTRGITAALLLAAAAAAIPATSGAQRVGAGTVVGMVTDSTVDRPLADALVQLSLISDPVVGFSVRTDSLGEFEIDSVPPGRYAIGFFHPRIDSLSLREQVLGLDVADSVVTRADLGLPSPATVYAAVCGGDGTEALLLGIVRDADTGEPVADGTVTATWSELLLDQRGLRNQRRIINVRSDSGGRFAMCKLSAEKPVRVQAATGASSAADESGEVELTLEPGRAAWRDLRIGRGDAVVLVAGPDSAAAAAAGARITRYRRGSARLVGEVHRRDGAPQADAQVLVAGSGLTATTDARGTFRLDSLAAGTATVEVRALGYAPASAVVDLASGRTDTAQVRLADRLPILEGQTIYGDSRERSDMTGFLKRSKSGAGTFITPEQIAQRQAFDVTDYLRAVPGLRVVPSGGFGGTIVLRNCTPTVFVDGMQVFQGAEDLSDIVRANDVAGIEVYNSPTSTPAEFQRGMGSCGAVVVWTKGRLR
ncbi:MAG: carboxypeptidase regulatory-like domain-containing protein [Gemmatimonadaceae bacterium]